ncbi:hypothetical protein TH53_14325 [Pedobacter lusitanus]|uniref:Uncharacterized protein n=1 Tax=Pedobacter lusitanus TaxID=1503925 RepID=A0A0D0FVP2_9SPHI|nr:hypothetical protein [Pedobacter lusitanus]KIO76534.1 hypothetical protein TH53_14325 [Pedobacter lusitanus]
MKPSTKNYYNTPSVLVKSLEAIENFQAAHKLFLKKKTEDSRKSMAHSLQTVKTLQNELSIPDESADQIRIAFLKQVITLEQNIENIHKDGLYPDLYRDSESSFRLLKDILDSFKISLLSKGESHPFIELSTSNNEWKDHGVIAFCRDVKNNLNPIRFKSLWDALQCYEKNKTQLTYTFEILSITGNLGKQP